MRIVFFLLLAASVYAQKPCEYSDEVKDSIGIYKSTKNVLMYERNFAGNSSMIYFSLVLSDQLPLLNIQLINKSKDFIKSQCFDKSTRAYLQLADGKIITLLHGETQVCGTAVTSDDGYNNRVLSSYFLFPKDSVDALKASPVSLLRLRFMGETTDYVIKTTLISEREGTQFYPETYFMDYLHCVIN